MTAATTSGSDTLLSVRGVSKRFGGIQALRDVDVDFAAGEIHGLIGPNGSGKSTLLSIVSGAQKPDGGSITVAGATVASFRGPRAAAAAGIERMPQELALVATMTVADNIVLGQEPARGGVLSSRRINASAADALARLQVDIDPKTPVAGLRPSQQRLVMLARTLHRGAQVIIADEPTAGLQPADAHHVTTALVGAARAGLCVIYVSHHLDEVARIAAKVTVLRDGRVVRRFGAQTNRDALLAELMQDSSAAELPARAERRPGTVLLEVTGLAAGSVSSADLAVARHDIVGVAGLLGSGRDDLLPAIVGQIPRRHGTVTSANSRVRDPRSAARAGLGYLSGDRTRSVLPGTAITTHVTLPTLTRFRRRGMSVSRPRERRAVQSALHRVKVDAEQGRALSTLSGGNQQRALLARWFVADAQVLLVDEPVVGVDVAARAALLAELSAFAEHGAVLVASSDLEDLFPMCSRILCFRAGVIVAEIARGQGWQRQVAHAVT